VAILIMLIAISVLVASTSLMLLPLPLPLMSRSPNEPLWPKLLAHYSMLVTAPVSIAISVAALRYLHKKKDRAFALFFVLGPVIGLGVGLLLVPLTGGYSLVVSPPVASITMIVGWIVLRARRKETNAIDSNP
jgi:uncharacterized membrane protein YgdD (TMEM256/DUF423 family)